MSAHTPGPWTAEYSSYGGEIWFGGEGCGMWSVGPAYLGGEGEEDGGLERMEANARLIAAAPELLDALKLIASMPGFEPDEPYGQRIIAAIAKATGTDQP